MWLKQFFFFVQIAIVICLFIQLKKIREQNFHLFLNLEVNGVQTLFKFIRKLVKSLSRKQEAL